MTHWLRTLYSLAFWAFVALSSAALFPIAVLTWLVTLPLDPRKVVLHRFTCVWASLYTWLNPAWRVTVEGREKLASDRAAVMVANHLSLLDILVLFRVFTHFKWVSKIENFRIPLVGWNMSLNRYIKLRRGDRSSIVKMLKECERTIVEGSSIMMFPEGTRSPSGRIRSFKTGAFEIALRTRAPIQPIVLEGTHDALPKSGFVLQGRHPIKVTVLDGLPYENFSGLTAEDLSEHVRNLIVEQLEKSAKEREALAVEA